MGPPLYLIGIHLPIFITSVQYHYIIKSFSQTLKPDYITKLNYLYEQRYKIVHIIITIQVSHSQKVETSKTNSSSYNK